MLRLFLTLYVLFSLWSLTATTTLPPRMTFTEKETTMKRVSLTGHHNPVGIIVDEEPDTVIAAGRKHLNSFDFQNPQKRPAEIHVMWPACIDGGLPARLRADCNYNITIFHKREEANCVFLCGTNGKETLCCDMNLSQQSPLCLPSAKTDHIKKTISEFIPKEGEQFALLDSPESDLYIAYSGSQGYVGIHKFGKHRVGPARHNKEQHYVGLVLSRLREPLKRQVYAFYREKTTDRGLYGEMWLPFVARLCMGDRGGPKNILQFSWTSEMNAPLFCGDADSGERFSELVDAATVHADQWQDTRVYALFRNEWGMSAVCVYTIQDIDHIFATSPFKGEVGQTDRPRKCVEDSRKIQPAVLKMIKMHSEMKQLVRPVNNRPLLSNHHYYTHIHVSTRDQHQTVLFLSLNNGGIHKVMQNKSQAFIIAEYQPFTHRANVVSINLQPSSGKLYVSSRNELVQLNVANCGQYGNTCELCVLARDPDCGWNGTHCTPNGTLQDVTYGNHAKCSPVSTAQFPDNVFQGSTATHAAAATGRITLPPNSKYFLRCPVSSHHARYTWRHLERNHTSCNSREQQCLLLIDSMGPEQAGAYTCVSEEMGYSRVVAQYQLQLEGGAAGRSSSPLIWLCLMALLIKSLS
ncbi:semaphorin-7A [Clinocottus analis]|uniref:semaphorin-7A n=1 Tax=Clinocottus analis TaxID=304258 RepID=UPI0035C23C53